MIIRAELKCKQTGCEADTCAVDKVIELPSPRFRLFSRALLADYDFIVGNKILLSPSRPMPLRSAQNPHNCWVFETIYHSSCVLFDRPLHSKSCIKIVVVCRHIFL